jgi:uncharacterized protein (DUF1697 family)
LVRYVSMLRGVNVGGQRAVKMDNLKKIYSSLGFQKMQTYLQSGNVVFDGPAEGSMLAKDISTAVRKKLGLDVVVILRTAEELQEVIDSMPFNGKDPEKLHVTFLSGKPKEFPTAKVDLARGPDEECSVRGTEVYLFCPDGYGRTKLSNSFFERTLKVQATTRNWRTVNALSAMASQ